MLTANKGYVNHCIIMTIVVINLDSMDSVKICANIISVAGDYVSIIGDLRIVNLIGTLFFMGKLEYLHSWLIVFLQNSLWA